MLTAARPGTPIYVREVLEEAARVELEPVSRARRPLGAGGVLVMSVVRDEIGILPDFLAHYRGLGAERFVFLDNRSADGSAELLAAEPDVDLLRVRRPFRSPMKQGWINRAIAEYGYGRWYLYADADEHLVFDGAGARGLPDLVALAEARGMRRLRGMLVDMYAEGPAFAPGTGQGTGQGAGPGAGGARPLAERFPLFDADSYAESLCKQRVSRKGGPRRRFFQGGGVAFDPELTKYPLFHIREGEVFDNPHHLHPYAENFISPCHLGLLHYKFHDGFRAKIEAAVAEGNYYNDSVEYRVYLRGLRAGDAGGFAYPGSRRYQGPGDLVASGLIEPLPWPDRAGSEAATGGARGPLGWARRLARALGRGGSHALHVATPVKRLESRGKNVNAGRRA